MGRFSRRTEDHETDGGKEPDADAGIKHDQTKTVRKRLMDELFRNTLRRAGGARRDLFRKRLQRIDVST